MVNSACGIKAVYMCFKRTVIWGGHETLPDEPGMQSHLWPGKGQLAP